MSRKYELVMGLETHVRVKSNTKMFCRCQNAIELADEANSNVCPICMGFPGMLPALSEGVVDLAVRASHAMRMHIQPRSIFDRKSYFYPDSPTGYQITQLYSPIALDGVVRTYVEWELKTFRIERMHIETDAGKLMHAGAKTLIDYNRVGSPLMEIVTKPDFRTKEEVVAYLEELQKLMRWCGASDADMEKGQLRCDVNISLRPHGSSELRSRVELKNINSFSAIGRAIDHEYARQEAIYDAGGVVGQETRGWNDEHGESTSQRTKEDAMDYRYFPEPDLSPLILSEEYIASRSVAELPIDRREKYLGYGLGVDDARILSSDRIVSDYFEELILLSHDAKKSCSYLTSVVFALLENSRLNGNHLHVGSMLLTAPQLAEVILMVNRDELSSTNAKVVIETLYREGGEASEVVERLGLKQTNDMSALEAIVDSVLAEGSAQLAEYKAGKVNLFGFFVGSCMKKSWGKGNPKIFTEILKGKIG